MHEIRLAGPWEQHVPDASPPEWKRISLPFDSGNAEFFTIRRRFHRPSGLEASTRVVLRVESVQQQLDLKLNDEHVIPGEVTEGGWMFDVTSGLGQFNEIVLSGGHAQVAEGGVGMVYLRILEAQG